MGIICETGQDFGSIHKLTNGLMRIEHFMIKTIKKIFYYIFLPFILIKNAVVFSYKSVSGVLKVIKGIIDVVYKTFFIAFFIGVSFGIYKIFSGYSTINKKLDDLKASIKYIQNVSEDLSRATSMLSNTTEKIKKIGVSFK